MPYTHQNTLTIGAEYFLFSSFSIRADYRYVGKVYTDFQNIEDTDNIGVSGPVPAYNLLNISGNFKFNSKLNVFFSGKNVLGAKYIGSRLHSNPGQKQANISSGIIPGPGKQVNFGLEYLF